MRRPAAVFFCVIGVCFSLVSLPFIGIGYFFYTSSVNSLHSTIQTNGTIVTTCNGNTNTTCYPIVSFRTQSGKREQFASNFSSGSMHQGDIVPVNYHPKDPQDAVISSFTSLWLFPVLLGGIGGFLLLIAIVLFILALVFVFGKRSRVPSASVVSSAPLASVGLTAPSDSMVPTVPSVSMAPTVPPGSIDPTVPSVSMAPTVPSNPPYPYHDPRSYNPYR